MAFYTRSTPTSSSTHQDKQLFFSPSFGSVHNSPRPKFGSIDSVISEFSREQTIDGITDDDDDSTMIRRDFLQPCKTPSASDAPGTHTETYFSFNKHSEDSETRDPLNKDITTNTTLKYRERSESEILETTYANHSSRAPLPIRGASKSITNRTNLTTASNTIQDIIAKSPTSLYSLDEGIKALQFGRYHKVLLFIISLITFGMGFQYKLTNILTLLIENGSFMFDIPDNADSLLFIAYAAGMIGGVLICNLSDKFGRKNAISIAFVAMCIFTALQIISWNFTMLMVSRVLIGCSIGVAYPSSLVLLIEYVPNKWRFRSIYFMFLVAIFSAIICTLISYVVFIIHSDKLQMINYRTLLIIISISVWLMPLLNYGYLPSSPHFVALSGKTDKVMDLLKTVDGWNTGHSFFHLLEQQQLTAFTKIRRKSRGKISDLFLSLHIRRTSIILAVLSFSIWFVAATIWRLQFLFIAYFKRDNGWSYDEDPFEDLSASTLFAIQLVDLSCDLLSTLVILLFMNFMDRRRILHFGFALNAGLLSVIMVVLLFRNNGMCSGGFADLVGIACCFMVSMSVDMCWYVLQIYIMEYYPTVVRVTALGFLFYGIGSIALMCSFGLAIYIGSSWIMIILYVVFSMIGILCSRLLEVETRNKALETYMSEAVHVKHLSSSIHVNYDYVQLAGSINRN